MKLTFATVADETTAKDWNSTVKADLLSESDLQEEFETVMKHWGQSCSQIWTGIKHREAVSIRSMRSFYPWKMNQLKPVVTACAPGFGKSDALRSFQKTIMELR